MARTRVRARVRKAEDQEAHDIASGVYSVARDISANQMVRHLSLAFPRPISAPFIYVAELIAVHTCEQRGWSRERADALALYFLQGIQEATVAMVASFDEEHFDAWIAAAELNGLV